MDCPPKKMALVERWPLWRGGNRPFYRYDSHIVLIRFKEYYRMRRGYKHISFVFWSAFWDKIVMGKKIFVLCLDVIMIAFFWFSIRNMVFHCVFLGKKAIIITTIHPNTAQR